MRGGKQGVMRERHLVEGDDEGGGKGWRKEEEDEGRGERDGG